MYIGSLYTVTIFRYAKELHDQFTQSTLLIIGTPLNPCQDLTLDMNN